MGRRFRQAKRSVIFVALALLAGLFPTSLSHPLQVGAASSASTELHGVYAVNSSIAWVVGFKSPSGSYQDDVPVIAATTNGGTTWRTQSVPNNVTVLNAVYFVSANVGWAAGYYDATGFGQFVTGVVLTTTNGGATWSIQPVPASVWSLDAITFVSASVGWAVGRDQNNQGVVLKTGDGGSTWTPQTIPANIGHLYGVSFSDVSNGWAVGQSYTSQPAPILRTSDGGQTWVLQTAPPQVPFLLGVSATSQSVGLAVGRIDLPDNSHPVVLQTTDAGNTWTRQQVIITETTDARGFLYSVTMVDATHGWAVGALGFGTGYVGLVLTTSDGGTTWTQVQGQFDFGLLLAGAFTDATHGWAVGYGSGIGQLNYTADGGTTWTSQDIIAGPTTSDTPAANEVDPYPIDELPSVSSAPGNVNTATGSFWRTTTDLTIAGRGMPLTFDRTYDSARAGSDGPLGFGWTDSYNVFLTVDASGAVTIHEENGTTIGFAPNGSAFSAPSRVLASLVRNADGGYTLTRKNQVKLVFGPTGQLVQEIDRDGYTTTLGYNGAHLASVTEPAGRSLSLTYGPDGRLAGLQDPAGRQLAFGYDASGNLTSAKDVGGGTTRFGYDAAHRMTSMTDPRGGLLQVGYDSTGRVINELDPMQRQTSFGYAQGAANITNADGSVRVDRYSNNELTSRTEASGTNVAGTWTYAYDPATLGVVSVGNPDGHTSQSTYDGMGNILTHSDALGRTSRYTYDALNDLLTVTDPVGQLALVNTYDGRGNLTQVTKGQLAVTALTYDQNQAEDLTAAMDPNHKVWHYGYDASGNRVSATDPLGGTMTASYDAAGRMLSTVSPRGNKPGVNPALFTTQYTYDAFGDVTQVRDPIGAVTKFQYDGNRNQILVTDADGHSTRSSYNADNQPFDAARADGTHLKTAYDVMGRVIQQTDPLNNSVGYSYDLRGRLSTKTDAFRHTTQYGYSAAGDLLTMTDPRLRTTTYGYDPADELTSISYSDAVTPSVALEYDANGRRISMRDGSGTSRYGYDTLSRLVASSDGNGQLVGYGYDPNSNLTSITYPGGSQVTRSYDDAGHLASVSDWLNNSSVFSYDADGNLIRKAYPNSVVSSYAYDPAGRLQVIDASNGGTGRFRRFAYSRDAAGLVTTQSDMLSQMINGVIVQSTVTTNNTYDRTNRLTGVSVGSTHGTLAYDSGDNPTSRQIGGTGVTSTFDAGHELSTQKVFGTSYTFAYDAQGNRIQRSTTGGPTLSYAYDQANRLTAVGTSVSFAYNGDGLRVSKTRGGGSPQPFTWELGDGTPVLIKDASASYVTGPGGQPIEQIMANGAVFFIVPDELGSTEVLTDAAGRPATQYAYPDPYGSVTLSQGPIQTPFLYAGQYTDSETGLLYMLSRYYDPISGNFLTADSGAGITKQPYTYAGDSPLNAGGLSGKLPSLSGTPEPTADLLHRVLAAGVSAVGDSLGETHDELVSGDPLHVGLGVVNSLLIAASVLDIYYGLPVIATRTAARVGAREAALSLTKPGETFVRVASDAQHLNFSFLTPGGAVARTYAFPLETFERIGMNPVALKNLGDLPGEAPLWYRVLEPPAGSLIQRGIVPGGEHGGVGGVEEVFFPAGF